MRCLYCGKELALLKRLTGSGDFCCEAHKQSYQEEYNRLALSRLLQAQKKAQQASAPAQTSVPPAVAVAVEEPAPEPQAESPVREVEVQQSTAEAAPAETFEDTTPAVTDEPEAVETAGFLVEFPVSAAASAEAEPYQEPQVETVGAPALSEWQAESPANSFQLSPANLQALDWALNSSSIAERAPSADLPAQEWPSTPPVVSSAGISNNNVNKTMANRLAASGRIALQIDSFAGDPACDRSFVQPLELEGKVVFQGSQLLELSRTSIEFPAEDSDVVVLEPKRDGRRDFPLEDTTPKSSLEALSRLHQEMIEEQEARDAVAEPEPVPVAAIPEVVAAPAVVAVSAMVAAPQLAPPEVAPQSAVAALASGHAETEEHPSGPVTIEIVPDDAGLDVPEAAEQVSPPKFSTELLEISLRIFPPSKGTPRSGELLASEAAPLLPHLKGLPLRPKVARGHAPAPQGAASTETVGPGSGRKPPARQPKPVSAAAKPVQPVRVAKTALPEAAKPAAPPAAQTPAPIVETPAAEKPPVASPALTAGEKPESVKPAEPLKPEPPRSEAPKSEAPRSEAPAIEPPKFGAYKSEAVRSESAKKEDLPSFGLAQPGNIPWYGSLKVKLGIAIVLLLIASVYFLWGGKHSPVANPTGEGLGPSIILGEGGWVEGWGGDPSGLHAGRQITIYRPSLKLSDYRIEFQGSIDVKSIGWVFRAADPQNYYAMKIATVSPALPLKVALFKYLVANGRQTQVGRVPIDMNIQPDTVFNIREDVRGPHFTTYIQGQQIDSWTDDQLKVGGVGFLNEREERGKVSSVSIRYLTGGK